MPKTKTKVDLIVPLAQIRIFKKHSTLGRFHSLKECSYWGVIREPP
jgi:hypothetical protein